MGVDNLQREVVGRLGTLQQGSQVQDSQVQEPQDSLAGLPSVVGTSELRTLVVPCGASPWTWRP